MSSPSPFRSLCTVLTYVGLVLVLGLHIYAHLLFAFGGVVGR